ncbi:flagellar hook capping FlgD N-terminal domain-containing protein [Rubellimicrobium arenae]|uniref:flagellar hook capping FlgD N-terminal domain-containing protein n=1 Tax=Rubellimicrobium arenae TaxID=2817372 RepID=UPI001FF042A6|nr:flagellar hook capping FlgD N-terminal domain-containing protein [Rubellimicrobium arenae]
MDSTAITSALTTSATGAATTASTTSSTSGKAAPGDFNTFLRMLTVQMQNQDPLDPIDSADYAVQLATFSGVEQQVKTNEILNSLSGQLTMSGMAQLAGWVGQEARAAMPAWFDGAPITISPHPLADADEVKLVVKDADGKEVSTTKIPASSEPIEWAGVTADGSPVPQGFYSFDVVSLKDGKPVQTDQAELYAAVTEVRSEGGKTILVLDGGATVETDKVTALRAAS